MALQPLPHMLTSPDAPQGQPSQQTQQQQQQQQERYLTPAGPLLSTTPAAAAPCQGEQAEADLPLALNLDEAAVAMASRFVGMLYPNDPQSFAAGEATPWFTMATAQGLNGPPTHAVFRWVRIRRTYARLSLFWHASAVGGSSTHILVSPTPI